MKPADRSRRVDQGARVEGLVLVLILLAVAGFAGAASFTHVKDWTLANSPAGTGAWFGWANAVISELVPIAALLTIRQRRRSAAPIGYPMTLLALAAGLSLAAQLAVAKPGPSGWLLSAVPALAFMALAKLVLAPVKAGGDIQANAKYSTVEPAATQGAVGNHPASQHPPTAPPAATADPPDNTPSAAVPVRLLPTARYAVVNHEQHHGRPITIDELADRLAVTHAVAGRLLAVINPPAAPASLNGANGGVTPTGGGR
jgi:hypothetical protein